MRKWHTLLFKTYSYKLMHLFMISIYILQFLYLNECACTRMCVLTKLIQRSQLISVIVLKMLCDSFYISDYIVIQRATIH